MEFADGCIDDLPVPTDTHQSILKRLFLLFDRHVDAQRGAVHFASLRLRIGPGRCRELDLLLLLDVGDARRRDRYWLGADLVLEVVNPDNPGRDYLRKRGDDADVGVSEHWIVDPQSSKIIVLTLRDGRYVDREVFRPGDVADSALLGGLRAGVSDVFDAGLAE